MERIMKRILGVALRWIPLNCFCDVQDSSVHSWINSQIVDAHRLQATSSVVWDGNKKEIKEF